MTSSKAYWSGYYQSDNDTTKLTKCSTFAQFVVDQNCIQPRDTVMEWGCGNGRDANYLSTKCRKMIAVDIAKSNHLTNFNHENIEYSAERDFSNLDNFDDAEKVNVIYSRFTLHSVRKVDASKAIKWAKDNLVKHGLILIEARSVNDTLFGKGSPVKDEKNAFIERSGADDEPHFRRFIVLNELTDELEQNGFSIKSATEANNLSIYKGDNPHLVRVVACKK